MRPVLVFSGVRCLGSVRRGELDAVFELTKKAVRRALWTPSLKIEINVSDTPGVYTMHFKESDTQDRMLWIMTQIHDDFPKASTLKEAGIHPDGRIKERNDGLSISFGSFGKAKEIMDEIGTALAFLGPVIHQDERLGDDQLFKTPDPQSLGNVFERYDFSLYNASNLLMALRRGGVKEHKELEAFVKNAWEGMSSEDAVARGGYAKARQEADAGLTM